MIETNPVLKKLAPLIFLFSALSHFKHFIKKARFLFLLIFAVFSFKGNAQCTITGATVNSSSISCAALSSSGCTIIYIGDGVNATNLVMNNNLNFTCLGTIQLIVRNNANIDFSDGNYDLELAVNSSIIVESGGNISAGSNCSASDLIRIGLEKVASCNGQGGALTDFPNLVSGGGYNTVVATSSIICGSGTSTITAVKNPTPTNSTTYSLYDLAAGGTAIQTITVSSAPYIANFTTPTLTSTTNYYIDATTSGITTQRRQVIVTVVAKPTAPTLGTITQPTCSTATGSVQLNGLPTGNWTINPGAISGNTANTIISGLATGSYNYTVTNAAGCTSLATANVVINSQPTNNVWNGSTDNNWNNPVNWCTGVPTISNPNTLNVLIPSGLSNYPTINSSDAAEVINIEIESGATLNIVNNYLKVTGNLTLNGKIDLNNESQLIQIDGSSLYGSGTIEIDQQGTSDNFKYNYWGSPVNTTGTSYTIAGVLRDGTDPNASPPFKPITFGAPYDFADGAVTSPIRLSSYWMYKYANLGNGYSGWTWVGKDGNLNAGEGFTLKGSNTNLPEQNYTFEGKPNNGDINLTISANFNYLIGNPYPSAIDAKQFIRDNINVDVDGNTGNRLTNIIDGNLYFWDHFGGGNHLLKSYEGGYAIYNLSGSVVAVSNDVLTKNTGATSNSGKVPQRFIPVAQGFFVTALDGGQIQFKNSQRVFIKENASVSQFMKSAKTSDASKEIDEDTFPRIRLNYSSPKGYQRQILVAFIENTTDGVDIGYDAINNETFVEDMSWRTNNINFIIQAVPTLNDQRNLPLEVKVATTGIIKISIDNTENIQEDTEIFMEDSTTGKRHNISKNQFEIELAAGKYTDRFAITFKTQKLVTEDVKAEILISAAAQPIIEGIHVVMNNAIGELQIKNNSTEEILSVALVNTLGQAIKTWNSNFNIRTISLPLSTATGVYLVQITTKTGNTVKKISVE